MIGKIIIPKPTTTKVIMEKLKMTKLIVAKPTMIKLTMNKVIITKLTIMKSIMLKPPKILKNYGSINHI